MRKDVRQGWVVASVVVLVTSVACRRDTDPQDASKAEPENELPAAPRAAQEEPKLPSTMSEPNSPPQHCGVEAEWPGGERQARELDLPGGCVFVATPSGAQIEKTEQGETLLVVSSHPLKGRPGDGDTRVRAVVVRGERLAVSTGQQVIRMCGAEGPFDSMLFHTLAASAKGLD